MSGAIEWNESGETSVDGRWKLNSETIRGEGRWWWLMSGPEGAKEIADRLGLDMASCTSSAKRTIQNRCARIESELSS